MKEIKIEENISVTVANETYRTITEYCKSATEHADYMGRWYYNNDVDYENYVSEESARWAKLPEEFRMADCAVEFLWERDACGASCSKDIVSVMGYLSSEIRYDGLEYEGRRGIYTVMVCWHGSHYNGRYVFVVLDSEYNEMVFDTLYECAKWLKNH